MELLNFEYLVFLDPSSYDGIDFFFRGESSGTSTFLRIFAGKINVVLKKLEAIRMKKKTTKWVLQKMKMNWKAIIFDII